jgi:hypothetical protein
LGESKEGNGAAHDECDYHARCKLPLKREASASGTRQCRVDLIIGQEGDPIPRWTGVIFNQQTLGVDRLLVKVWDLSNEQERAKEGAEPPNANSEIHRILIARLAEDGKRDK